MRHLIAGVACAGLLLLTSVAHGGLSVFACEPEWAALVEELAGEHARVFSATHAGQDPHHVEARPSLIARLRSADLAVCTGAELEVGWLPMLQRRARNPKVLAGAPGMFEAAQQTVLLEVPTQLDRAEGDVHADGNPHIQLDPRRVHDVAKALSARLQMVDPANRAEYATRFRAFDERWQTALSGWQAQAAPLRGKQVIVYHREWIYLLDWLGMNRVGSLEPKPGIPPTVSHLAALKQQKADLIILSPLNDTGPSKWLHDQAAVPVVVLPQTVGAVAGADNLFRLFDEVVRRLVEAGTK